MSSGDPQEQTLLTGSGDHMHNPMQVIARLMGEKPLPWEGGLTAADVRHLGMFRGPVLRLLHRDPAHRISMRRFHIACTKLFAARTTVEA